MFSRTLPAASPPGGYDGRQDGRNRRTQEGPDGGGHGCEHAGVEAGAAAICHYAELVAPLIDVAAVAARRKTGDVVGSAVRADTLAELVAPVVLQMGRAVAN